MELLCRCARHIFREYIRTVESHCLAASIAHFLNILVGSGENAYTFGGNMLASLEMDLSRKYKKKRRTPANGLVSSSCSPTPKSIAWTKLTQEAFWKELSDDSLSHFDYVIPCKNCDSFIEWSGGAKRVAIIRRFCILSGIQLALKVYNLFLPIFFDIFILELPI